MRTNARTVSCCVPGVRIADCRRLREQSKANGVKKKLSAAHERAENAVQTPCEKFSGQVLGTKGSTSCSGVYFMFVDDHQLMRCTLGEQIAHGTLDAGEEKKVALNQ